MESPNPSFEYKSKSRKIISIPDYLRKHLGYRHMECQVGGMMGGQQIPKRGKEEFIIIQGLWTI